MRFYISNFYFNLCIATSVLNFMLKKERQTFIMKQVNLHNRVLSAELSTMMEVSEDTVRRDLNEMADAHTLVKVHGGALSNAYHFGTATNTYAAADKRVIASKAISLIKNDMFVLVGGGTTVREIVAQLPTDVCATFLTISLVTALQLCDHATAKVIFLGGQVAKESQVSTGGEVISRLSEISADLCILGTNGISPEGGVTDADAETVQVKRAMMKAARQTAIVTISEKLGTNKPMRVCELKEISFLITELPVHNTTLTDYRAAGLVLL